MKNTLFSPQLCSPQQYPGTLLLPHINILSQERVAQLSFGPIHIQKQLTHSAAVS